MTTRLILKLFGMHVKTMYCAQDLDNKLNKVQDNRDNSKIMAFCHFTCLQNNVSGLYFSFFIPRVVRRCVCAGGGGGVEAGGHDYL